MTFVCLQCNIVLFRKISPIHADLRIGEQGHDDDHGLGRGAQPLADRACGGAERLATLRPDDLRDTTRKLWAVSSTGCLG